MTMLGDDELHRRLGYHPATPETAPIYELNRSIALLVAGLWDRMLPGGRELAEALTYVQGALMYANAAVACNPPGAITRPDHVDVATLLDDVIERLEGPEMRRSGHRAPPRGPDRPPFDPDADIGPLEGNERAVARYRRAMVTPLAARDGDQLARRRRGHEGDDDL